MQNDWSISAAAARAPLHPRATCRDAARDDRQLICGAKEPIEESEILYQNDLVCILKPNVKKGILVWTQYIQPSEMNNLCELELKTEKELKSKSIPYIFFRAPYYSRDIDYTSVETEIKSSYGEEEIGTEPKVFIRVDPDKTFVFSSEIREKIPDVYFHISDGHLITKQELSSTHSKFLNRCHISNGSIFQFK